ncbi:hypothetical protein ANCCAN_05549 [Ancylostoma caninum]|uniref:Neurotransmitter-gated ion-channel ligand-binding domain-containing protein n=1 Tax=Ancylostoma caninum TaxID=29170 RepID=A0A368GVM0_ANCCA|nr:hypothetical protein ANCCAN_05549 [Ancylostoma caninum]
MQQYKIVEILTIWKDRRLSWNASEYGNIKEIIRRKTQLDGKMWLPKIYLSEIFFLDDMFDYKLVDIVA